MDFTKNPLDLIDSQLEKVGLPLSAKGLLGRKFCFASTGTIEFEARVVVGTIAGVEYENETIKLRPSNISDPTWPIHGYIWYLDSSRKKDNPGCVAEMFGPQHSDEGALYGYLPGSFKLID